MFISNIFKETTMRNFTYYEAEKFLKEIAKNKAIDIDNFDLNKHSDAKEISNLLDVSESTANNWLSGRTDLSKLGKQALAYQLILDLVHTYNNTPRSNVVVKKQDIYEIYSDTANGEYELLATTTNIKLARTIKEIQKIYNILDICRDFISTELETREANGYEDFLVQPYRTNLNNLIDLMNYIQDGVTFSEKYETLLHSIDLNFDAKKFENTSELETDRKDVISEFISPTSRIYKGQIDTQRIPEGTLIRRIVKKGEKEGIYELKKVGDKIVYQKNGKSYTSINAACGDILGYEENVKENWYFQDNITNEWKKCKHLVEDE